MATILEDRLLELREAGMRRLYPPIPRVTVGMGTCGLAAGAGNVFSALEAYARNDGAQDLFELEATGCNGFCWAEPVLEIQLPGGPRAVYGGVQPESAARLVDAALRGELADQNCLGLIRCNELLPLGDRRLLDDESERDFLQHPFLQVQKRLVLRNCGHIDPSSIAEYVAQGGYQALETALLSLRPEEVIELVEASGLRGRGGAGFPTGKKWRLTRHGGSTPRYVIANADEGDPGAYMDRALLESDPHSVLEGLILAAYAVGADRAYVFTRSEYPLAIVALRKAIEEAKRWRLLGDHILGSEFSLEVNIVRSAGAFVCGEESAMLHAMQNARGEPQPRPPYPAERGLWGRPTCVNNVETLANVPLIVARGPDWYRQCGTADSPGTKVFSLVGAVQRTGLVEVPLGTSLWEILEQAGGCERSATKALQIGGPSGGILPTSLLDVPVDYEGLAQLGAIMGSGGLVVLGQGQCVVDTALYFLHFTAAESCGKCTPCRDGLTEAAALLEEISSGKGQEADLDKLEDLGRYVAKTSLCGLGKTAPNPLLTSMRYFHEEYAEHLAGHCPALVCKPLLHFEVIRRMCNGCRCCLPTCPSGALKGKYGKPFDISEPLCTKCWMCTQTCPYNAIKVTS